MASPGVESKYDPTKRTEVEMDRDRAEVSRMYLRGHTYLEIAAALNLSRDQVKRDLDIVRKQWQQSAIHDMEESKLIELAKIDKLECTYWDAWENSKREQEKKIQRLDKGGPTDRTSATVEKVQRQGDPRYLDGVMSCIRQRCRILGIEASEKLLQGAVPDGASGQAKVILLPAFSAPKLPPPEAARN